MPASVSISISLVIFLWTTIIIIHVATTVALVAKSQSSSLEQELKALNETGWWWPWGSEKNTSSPCELRGVVCNDFGSVKEIKINVVGIDSYYRVD